MENINNMCKSLLNVGSWVEGIIKNLVIDFGILLIIAMILTATAIIVALYYAAVPITWGYTEIEKKDDNTEKFYKRPYGIQHFIAIVFLSLTTLNQFSIIALNVTGFNAGGSNSLPINWIVNGVTTIGIALILLSCAIEYTIRSIRQNDLKKKIIGTTLGILMTSSFLFAGIIPVMTASVEITCSGDCHQQFIQSLKEFEKNEKHYYDMYGDRHDEDTKPAKVTWAANYLRIETGVNFATFLIVILFASGGTRSSKINKYELLYKEKTR